MKAKCTLTAAEVEALQAAVDDVGGEFGFPKRVTFTWFVDRWKNFVVGLEAGECHSLWDFLHGLSLREALEDIRRKVPPRVAEALARALQASDDRFRLATTPSAHPLPTAPDGSAHFWWTRLPRRNRVPLEQELADLGGMTTKQ